MNSKSILVILLFAATTCFIACNAPGKADRKTEVKPLYITKPVEYDTDDPAIWVNKEDPAKSLILGTDKDVNGGLYVYDLQGNIISDKTRKLQRPNNVDIAYGLQLGDKKIDIAVATERLTHKLRIYSLPDMQAIDNGGIPAFEGQEGVEYRDLMGIALYTSPDGKIYAIVGRKSGPTDGSYLWQYLLEDNGNGQVRAKLVRKFGKYSGKKEIESIAADNEMGYIYYSDEKVGVRKYYAEPANGNEELALFAKEGFTDDNEGISIYKTSDTTGYILVSDQGANRFRIYTREDGHRFITSVKTSTLESDGSEVVSIPLNNDFKHGLFVAMSTDKTFHLYRWEDISGTKLKVNGK